MESFSRAAEILGITQPAVSQKIKKLEAELGTKLVMRDGQLCIPTAAGRFFYESSKPLLADFDNLCTAVKDVPIGSKPSTLRIVTRSALFSAVFQTLVSVLKEADPDIKIDVEKCHQSKGHLIAVENGEADIALSETNEFEENMDLDFYQVCNSYLACVMPQCHRLANKPSITISELAEERMVLFQYMRETGAKQRNRMIYRELYNTHSSPANISFVDQTEMAVMLARAGEGITVVDSKYLLSMEGCVAIPLHENCFAKNGFYVKKNSRSKVVKTLIHATVNAFEEPMIIDSDGKMVPKRVFLEKHPIHLI